MTIGCVGALTVAFILTRIHRMASAKSCYNFLSRDSTRFDQSLPSWPQK